MKKYEVRIDHQTDEEKTLCSIEVFARVVQLIEGSEVKVNTGNIVFRRKGAADVTKPLTGGVAKLEFDENRQDEDRSVRVEAEFTDKDGITASSSTRIKIPAKKGQHGADTRPKYILVLEKPVGPEMLEGDGVKFQFPIRLTSTGDRNLAGKKPRIFLNGVVHAIEPITDNAGMAYPEIEFEQQNKVRQFHVTARVEVDGKTIVSSSQPITIIARKTETPKDEWKSRYDLELTAKRIKVGEDQYRFSLEAHLTRVEYCAKGEKRGEERQPRPVPQKPIFFKTNWKEMREPDNSPVTDKYGKTSLTTGIFAAKQFDGPVTFWAEALIENGDDVTKLLPSNRVEDIVPAATKVAGPPKLVKKIMVQKGDRYNGNTYMFRVTPLSDPDDLASTVDSIITAYGVPGEMRIGSGDYKPVVEFRGSTANGTATIELKLPPGTMGHMTLGVENTAVVSEPQQVKSQRP